jgi:phosphoglycerate dehydrogenase-like enzyme
MLGRVLITAPQLRDKSVECCQLLEKAGFEVVFADLSRSLSHPEVFLAQLGNVDAVIASTEPYTKQILAFSKLSIVARAGVGYDAVDLAAATEANVAVTIAPGTNHESVAEMTIALILAIYRKIPVNDRLIRAGEWKRVPGPRLAGKTLGVLGLGRTARAVIERAQGLKLECIACDPFADRAFAHENNVRLVTAYELFSKSDILSLHIPATPDTRHCINAETLAIMKPGSVLINTARGGLIDEAALAQSLASGHLYGAGLDVLQQEPPSPDHPLLRFENVIFTPHMAGVDQQSVGDMGTRAAQCIIDLVHGEWPGDCVVNGQLRGRWKWKGR